MSETSQKEYEQIFLRHSKSFVCFLEEVCLEREHIKIICQKFDAAITDAYNTGIKVGYEVGYNDCINKYKEYAKEVDEAVNKAVNKLLKLYSKGSE